LRQLLIQVFHFNRAGMTNTTEVSKDSLLKKMLKDLAPMSISLLDDGGKLCFEMDPPGVKDDQDPS
jgi:hypothetical protein